MAEIKRRTPPPRYPQCPRCQGAMYSVKECYDGEGIRRGLKCGSCRTRFAVGRGSMRELYRGEYETPAEWPQHIKEEEQRQFHEAALARGYVLAADDGRRHHGA